MKVVVGGEDKLFNLIKGALARTMTGESRAQAMGGNMVSLFIVLLIAAIVVLQVFIPVVNDAIASSGISGTEQTIVELLPLFGVLLLLIALAGPLMRRV